jgi:hypothetical protein
MNGHGMFFLGFLILAWKKEIYEAAIRSLSLDMSVVLFFPGRPLDRSDHLAFGS